MPRCEGRSVGRRDFLLTSAAATAAVLASDNLARAAGDGPTVVIVRDKARKAITGNNVDAAVVQKLVDQVVMKLAGKDDIAKAWAAFVGPKDKVAIKFNGLFPRATTHPEVVAAVTSGLIKAGVDPANIVIYDRHSKDFRTARITPRRQGPGPLAYATEKDYGPEVKAGPVSTRITNILLKADVLINLPIMKTHVLAGISGALKNHLGTVPNARDFHRDTCRHVADISALDPVKKKTRICICDAIYGLFDKGPQFRPNCRFDYHGIIASVDPVALDATLADILKARRLEKGLSPYHKETKHIARAAELGLGCADLAKIKRLEIEV